MMGRDKTTTALVAIAIAVWGVAAFFALRAERDAPPTELRASPTSESASAPTNGAGTASSPRSEASAPTSASPKATTSTSPTATASAGGSVSASSDPPPRATPEDPSACMGAALQTEGLDYGFVCDQTNPLKASGLIKSALVRHGQGLVTDAMRQWAGLGWYEMAAFAALRAHCCPPGEPLAYNFNLACPLDEAVNAIDAAVRTGQRAEVDVAVKRYGKEARCLDQFGQSSNMGRSGPPGAGIAALRKLLDAIVGEPE